ncbi:MAG: prephenate dehydrogenase [Oscillospiraceae bacterium]|nr:prephenate dehydrogenase [Oscillospiraceae bacterium]
MNIGIIGLGLIGGSLAKSIRQNTDNTVWGRDIKDSVVLKAQVVNAIDGELTDDTLKQCDLVIVALYPSATVDFVTEHRGDFKKGCIVIDCCGVKERVCAPLFGIARENGFTFIGAHPMAGIAFSGFDHSRNSLFEDASMILTPGPDAEIGQMHMLKTLFTRIGFSRIQMSTPKEHDEVIACTSQLAHVVSSAYVKSPAASRYKGFSAGSFKDMTRVAKLNEVMWTELFMDNRDNLLLEIDGITARLLEYRDALAEGDGKRLSALLREGSDIKISLG